MQGQGGVSRQAFAPPLTPAVLSFVQSRTRFSHHHALQVYGPESSMTGICKLAIDYVQQFDAGKGAAAGAPESKRRRKSNA